jgi:hypothetical protein
MPTPLIEPNTARGTRVVLAIAGKGAQKIEVKIRLNILIPFIFIVTLFCSLLCFQFFESWKPIYDAEKQPFTQYYARKNAHTNSGAAWLGVFGGADKN